MCEHTIFTLLEMSALIWINILLNNYCKIKNNLNLENNCASAQSKKNRKLMALSQS